MNRPRTAFPLRCAAAAVLALTGLLAGVAAPADDRALIGHWPLTTDGADASGNRLHTVNRRVGLSAKGPDGKAPAAIFDGHDSHLEVKTAPGLRLGTGDFTVALW